MSASELDATDFGAAARWSDPHVRLANGTVALVPRPIALPQDPLAARVVRRMADITIAGIGLLVALPLLIVVAIAIRLDSGGPAFFSQPRVGLRDNRFTMIKFRTMYIDAEERQRELEKLNESIGGILFKIREDPRVTRVGKRLRALNIDEIPQLINVLFGSMSIVGPRPLPLRDSELLELSEPREYHARLTVKPGITGEWQIRRAAESDCGHMLELDMEYLDSRCLRHDAYIAAKTVMRLLKFALARGS